MLQVDPAKRLTAEEVYEHPWVAVSHTSDKRKSKIQESFHCSPN